MPTFCACGPGCLKRVSFKGMYAKGHQPAGTSRDPDGKHKALNDKWSPSMNAKWNPINNPKWNPINNPINNPIYNAKKQKRARDEATVRIAKMPTS